MSCKLTSALLDLNFRPSRINRKFLQEWGRRREYVLAESQPVTIAIHHELWTRSFAELEASGENSLSLTSFAQDCCRGFSWCRMRFPGGTPCVMYVLVCLYPDEFSTSIRAHSVSLPAYSFDARTIAATKLPRLWHHAIPYSGQHGCVYDYVDDDFRATLRCSYLFSRNLELLSVRIYPAFY